MRIDIIKWLIAFGISALVSYGCYSLSKEEVSMRMLYTICSFLFLFITATFMLGVTLSNTRSGALLKVLSGIFFGVGIILHLIFGLFPLNQTIFLITDGLLLLIYALGANFIYKSKV